MWNGVSSDGTPPFQIMPWVRKVLGMPVKDISLIFVMTASQPLCDMGENLERCCRTENFITSWGDYLNWTTKKEWVLIKKLTNFTNILRWHKAYLSNGGETSIPCSLVLIISLGNSFRSEKSYTNTEG